MVRSFDLADNNIHITISQSITQNLTSSISLDLGTVSDISVNTRTRRVPNPGRRGTSQTRITGFRDTGTANRNVSSSETTSQSSSFNVDDVNTRNELVASGDEEFMRSRNTQFIATNLKPSTRYYQFLDGRSDVDFVPKLIEIATDSTLNTAGATNAFVVGETVTGLSLIHI